MKRIYTLWTIWMLSLIPMLAQTIAGGEIQVKKQSVSISDNQMILVGMDLTIPADMEISSDRMLTLTPVLKTNDGSANKGYIIKNAEYMLTTTDKSIVEIADTCGFNDSNYFSTIFKKIHGVSPREYRKSSQYI